MSTPYGRRSSSRGRGTYVADGALFDDPSASFGSEVESAEEGEASVWCARRYLEESAFRIDPKFMRGRRNGMDVDVELGFAGVSSEGSACSTLRVPSRVSRTSLDISSAFCCFRSRFFFNRSTLTRSQWDTLYGVKKPEDRSHQHLSAARMTRGIGPV